MLGIRRHNNMFLFCLFKGGSQCFIHAHAPLPRKPEFDHQACPGSLQRRRLTYYDHHKNPHHSTPRSLLIYIPANAPPFPPHRPVKKKRKNQKKNPATVSTHPPPQSPIKKPTTSSIPASASPFPSVPTILPRSQSQPHLTIPKTIFS